MSFRTLRRLQTRALQVVPLATLFAILAGAGRMEAAKLLPPAEYLKKPENVLIVARAVARVDEGKIVFRRRDTLHGESPRKFEVRVGEETERQIVMGDSYVLGVTFLRKVIRARHTYEPDPLGPRMVAIPAVGEALLEHTPAVLALVKPRKKGAELGDRDRLEAILAQVVSPHEPTRRFVLAEVILRPGLVGLLNGEEMGVLQRLVESSKSLEDRSHEYLLRVLLLLDEPGEQPWIAEDCRTVLESAEVELDLSSFEPALVLSAANLLGKVGSEADIPLMARHLTSNNPGVARAAFRSMLNLDRREALAAAAAALENQRLHPDTRRLLETAETTATHPADEHD